jgi:glutaminase
VGVETQMGELLRLPSAWPAPGSGFRSPIASLLDELLDRHSGLAEGAVASYIPELAEASPDLFGIAIATCEGSVYEAGDTDVPFTLQSISKPLTYALALEQLGAPAVHTRIGVEPSGDAFNSIALAPGSGMPPNAMVNAGAIAASSLVAEKQSFEQVLAAYSRFAGRPVDVDEKVYRSERSRARPGLLLQAMRRQGGLPGSRADRCDPGQRRRPPSNR